MNTAKLGLALVLAFSSAAMIGCSGKGSDNKNASVSAPVTTLDNNDTRQSIAKKLLERENFTVLGLRSTQPLIGFKTLEDFEKNKKTLLGYEDCFNVQQAKDTYNLFAKCVDTRIADQTMNPQQEQYLGVRIEKLSKLSP